MKNTVTGDEAWIYGCDVETKARFSQCSWKSDIFKQQKNRRTHQTLVYSSRHSTKTKRERNMRLVSGDPWTSPLGYTNSSGVGAQY
jgi:hypothetical protein